MDNYINLFILPKKFDKENKNTLFMKLLQLYSCARFRYRLSENLTLAKGTELRIFFKEDSS